MEILPGISESLSLKMNSNVYPLKTLILITYYLIPP